MNTALGTASRYPLGAIIMGLVGMGYSDLPVDRITEAWNNTLYPELERRIGERLSAGMTDAELDEFDALLDCESKTGSGSGPETTSSNWLTTHVPSFRNVVDEEYSCILSEAVDWFASSMSASTEHATQ